ncbi:MAG: hypothetical protein H7270_06975 [Dermatophilaceae bacterium]|nr:hypothetical protein [Dermatophilaceae bacterium]
MADIDDLLAAVSAGPQGPDVGEFFDFDGTLIHGYSAVLYFRQRMASRAVGPQELIGTLVEVFNMQQRGHDVTRLVAVHGQPCTGLASDDAINPAAQLISAARLSLICQLTGWGVGLRRHGYPYLGSREVCMNLNERVRLTRIGLA